MTEKHRSNNTRLYVALLALIVAGLALFSAFSFTSDDSADGNDWLVRTNISEYFKKTNDISVVIIEDTLECNDGELVQDTVPKRILLLGDSMVEGLSKPFGRYASQNGHSITSVIWYSSSSKTWALTDTLEYFIRKYSPDFVMVSLGGNEMFVNDLDKRRKYVSSIVKRLSDIPFVWIGPPNWKEDTGINDIIGNTVGSGRFFLSRNLTFERGKDGRHPTPASSCEWADTISSWIMNTSRYRIRMEHPADTVSGSGRVVVLSNARI